jgi:hypothetical protein
MANHCKFVHIKTQLSPSHQPIAFSVDFQNFIRGRWPHVSLGKSTIHYALTGCI